MSLLNPMALLLLLTVPGLVLLYFLKLKRPQVRVGSTLLWQKVIEDLRVNSPFQKLKRSLLMLLQILALLAIIFALVRPTFDVRDRTRQSVIVLLDTSASMMALGADGKGSRLDAAKTIVETLVSQLRRDDELMMITFDAKADMISGFSSNKRLLRVALKDVTPNQCPTMLTPALALARSVAASRDTPRVIVVSDGACESLHEVDMPFPVEYVTTGESAPNVAVAGLDIRRSMHDHRNVEMFVSVQNFSPQKFTGTMDVRLNGDLLDSKYIEVEGEQTLSKIFEATLIQGGHLQVVLDVDDALAVDNQAWKIITPPTQRRVLLVGEQLYFLERALRASPGVQFRSIRPEAYAPSALDGVSLVIWHDVSEPELAPCDNMYLACVPPMEGLALGETVKGPRIVDWDTGHPLARFLDFSNLILSDTASMALPASGEAILRAEQTPLIGLMSHPYGEICVVGFNPLKSNWPLLVSFPLFLNNAFEYFDDLRERKITVNTQTGRPLAVAWQGKRPEVTMPDGRRTVMEGESGHYRFTETKQCGIYSISSPDPGREPMAVAVNLFDRNESSLKVAENLSIGRENAATFEARRDVRREYWRPAAIVLLILLLVEWVLYHRRLLT
ncbi:MAG: Ca-activated chloride channel family protein [Candidatus Promineifilaceae bacterium]|jgi:Ca-activated chloride channel family protein